MPSFSKSGLLAAISACQAGLDNKMTLIQGADTLVFTGEAIHAYNDHIAVSTPFSSELHGAVKGEPFYRLISKIPSDSLEIIPEETEWKIISGSINASIKLQDSQILPHLEALKLNELTWSPLPEQFVSALRLCEMGNNTSPFKGIIVEGDAMFSTDSARIDRHTFPDFQFTQFWIEEDAAREIRTYDNLKEYAVSASWAHFRGEDGTVISTRTRDSEGFPVGKLRQILDAHQNDGTFVKNILPLTLADVVDRAMIFGQEAKGIAVVKLQFRKDYLVLAADRSVGNYEEKVPWETAFEEDPMLEVWVDATFLKEAVIKVKEFYIKPGDLPALIFHNANYMQLTNTIQIPSKG